MVVRFTYSRWDGTQEIPNLDANALLRAMGDELIEHGDPNVALRRMLHQGLDIDGTRLEGIREMLRKLLERRQERLEQHDLGGFYDEISEALDEVIESEQASLDTILEASSEDSCRGEVEAEAIDQRRSFLDMLDYENLAGRVRRLAEYDFTSAEAARRFEELVDRLKGHLMQQAVDQIANGMKGASVEDLSRTKDMLAELNRMLEQLQADEKPDFDGFMERFGVFFPTNPRSIDELLEIIALRMASMTQMVNSMSPNQRVQLEELAQELLDDMDLRWQMDQLSENLRNLFPEMGWDQSREFTGQDKLGLSEAMQMFEDLADMDRLEQMLRGANSPGALAEVDTNRVRDLLGDESAESLERLAEMTRLLEEGGLVANIEGQLTLTPRAVRQLGQNALGDLYQRLVSGRAGRHDLDQVGIGHERDFATKPYEFGDPFNLHIERTIRNALVRTGSGTPVDLHPEDFEVESTESIVQAATVLMLDLSLSMPMRDNFLPAKKVVMALHSLMSSRFPQDYLGLVTFSEVAREIQPERLPEISWDYVYGTNMQHGFVLARRMLANQRGTKQIIVVTDGEPTAHLTDDGYPFFSYPPSPETVERTLREVQRCTREDIRINVFMLDASPNLTQFIEQVTRMNGGRAFFTTNQSLGDYLLVDFVDHRKTLRTAR